MVHPVTHNTARTRFEAAPQGQLATCDYRRQGEVLVLHHTEVPAALQGRGIAAELVRSALDFARSQGLRVRPTCSYVASYMRRHPETLDLLEGAAVSSERAPTQPAEVLAFWFGQPPTEQPRAEWFRKDPAFDERIRQRFGAVLQQALDGGLRHWDSQPEGALARILVLDQFTRNAFRGTPRSFAGDAQALAAAQALVAGGGDQQLPPLLRWFAYLPFEHAEDRAVQRQSLQLFAELARVHPALADAHHWAVKHAEVIERFGRYPHRNAILQRPSTAEEEAFLREPGSSF